MNAWELIQSRRSANKGNKSHLSKDNTEYSFYLDAAVPLACKWKPQLKFILDFINKKRFTARGTMRPGGESRIGWTTSQKSGNRFLT